MISSGVEEVAYRYNQRGEISHVYNPDDGAATALATYTRRKDSLVSRVTFDSGSSTASNYDLGKRLTVKTHRGRSNNWIDVDAYTYDSRSRRTSHRWGGNVGDRFQYDAAGQVTGVEHDVANFRTNNAAFVADQSFVYDDMGNRESFTVTAGGASSNVFSLSLIHI